VEHLKLKSYHFTVVGESSVMSAIT